MTINRTNKNADDDFTLDGKKGIVKQDTLNGKCSNVAS